MVVDAKDLVHHRLVGPLVEEGRDRVVTAIQDEQQRRDVRVEGKQVMFSAHDGLEGGEGGEGGGKWGGEKTAKLLLHYI